MDVKESHLVLSTMKDPFDMPTASIDPSELKAHDRTAASRVVRLTSSYPCTFHNLRHRDRSVRGLSQDCEALRQRGWGVSAGSLVH